MTSLTLQRYFAGLLRNTFLLAIASFFADISTEMLYQRDPVFSSCRLAPNTRTDIWLSLNGARLNHYDCSVLSLGGATVLERNESELVSPNSKRCIHGRAVQIG